MWYFEASQLHQRWTSQARYRAEGKVRSANIEFIAARAHFMSLWIYRYGAWETLMKLLGVLVYRSA